MKETTVCSGADEISCVCVLWGGVSGSRLSSPPPHPRVTLRWMVLPPSHLAREWHRVGGTGVVSGRKCPLQIAPLILSCESLRGRKDG